MRARYSRWDSSQDPLGADFGVAELLDEMNEDLLTGFGANWSLENIRRKGVPGRARGLDDLRRQLAERRRSAAEELNLSAPLAQVRDELNEILALEREELARRTDDDARFSETRLDSLPRHPAAALRELTGYEFASQEAQRRFAQLMDELRRQVLDSYFGRLAEGMRNLAGPDMERAKDMLAELNHMIAARDRGDDYDFEGFMQRYGDMFPENPQSLDELLETLARRMAAMSSLLAGMSPDQRAELAQLAESVLGDLDLAFQVDQLARSLQELMPGLPWDEAPPAWGEGDMSMSAAVDAIERLGELEELEHALAGDYPGASLDDVDETKLLEALGDDAVADLDHLRAIEKMLEEAGILERSRGRMELTTLFRSNAPCTTRSCAGGRDEE